MNNTMKTVLAGAVAVATVVTLAACGDYTQRFQDAPKSDTVNTEPADVIVFPDGFSNVAVKCDGPNRVYSTYHGTSAYASIFVVPNDPRCAP